jgi:peroxiredoxin
MSELVQLEEQHEAFAKRKTRVVVISLEDQKAAELTQTDFPDLDVVADSERKLAEALAVIHQHSAPDGGDTTAPTTLLVDGQGIVRWTFRPDRFFRRLSPKEVLAAVDKYLPAE